MFQMARRARGRELLLRLVNRSVVASETSIVAHIFGERAGSRYVTKVALLCEDGVRSRKRPARIDLLIALDALGKKPSQR
jgi:hypothetical protein